MKFWSERSVNALENSQRHGRRRRDETGRKCSHECSSERLGILRQLTAVFCYCPEPI